MFNGVVTDTGYHPIYGNYVEVAMNNVDILVSSVKGERYRVTEIKIIYGYLLGAEAGGKAVSVNQHVSAGTQIGNSGLSGKTSGNQLYVAMYINCQRLDEDDNVIHTVGLLPYDIEKYFTTQFKSGPNFTVRYKND
jgi:murein DD-endopeptidase MepM/ murein hydrolase activator NlpD